MIIVLITFQWMLQIPGATSYIGCIGKDKFGEEMKKNAQAAGVNVSCKILLCFYFFFMIRQLIAQLVTINPAIYSTRPIIMRMRMLQQAHVLFVLLVGKGMLATMSSLQQACLNFNKSLKIVTRSLIANLSAANCYKSEHLKKPENWALGNANRPLQHL